MYLACLSCWARIFFLTASVPTDCGFRSSLVVGSCVLHRQLSNLWVGLVPMDSVGVFRCARTARYRSPPVALAFCRRCFASLTAASALPFVYWCPRLPGRCLKPHSLAKLLNFSQANCGPLSLMTMSGIPCLAKWHFSFFMTVLAFVSWRWSISE